MNIQNAGKIPKNNSKFSDRLADPSEFEKFVYILSHDIRASVRALLEVPQWIEEDLIAARHPIDGSLSEHLGLMNTHTSRLDRMLVDLLTFSRVGRMQTIQSADLEAAIQSVLDQAPLPNGFNIKIDLKHGDILIGDRDVLTLFAELITNSIKHHHLKTGTIEISSFQENSDCVICIRDDGPGIPSKYQSHVFEAMKTLRSRDEIEGSGMGLATVQKIVELYGGSLKWLDIPEGKGACLEMRFPN